MKLLRKALTRPIWWWEKRGPYPIREQIFDLPPYTVGAGLDSVLVVLTTPGGVHDAAWAAYSIIRHLPRDFGVTIAVDGELDIETTQKLGRLIPNVKFISTVEVLSDMTTVVPNIAAYGKKHPLGRKLALILHMQKSYTIVYSDSDVLGFGELSEINQAYCSQGSALYLQDVGDLCADESLKSYATRNGISHAKTLNSGFLFIPKESLNIDLANQLFTSGNYDPTSWFTEQTTMAILMSDASASPLPKEKYVVSNQRQFYHEKDVSYDEISIRHFTTPVRHVMYLRGMVWLKNKLSLSV